MSAENDSEPDDPGIPPSIELAWGRRGGGTRGPKRALTLQAIVDAGIALASTEGIEHVSMARVAKQLGVGTMSLYRYVLSKDELLTVMVDYGLGTPPAGTHGEHWRVGLTRWAEGVRAAYLRHPWSLKVPITAPPLGPNNVRWMEAALASMIATPLGEHEKLSTLLVLSGFVRSDATLAVDVIAAATQAARSGLAPVTYGAILSELTDPRDFPAVHRAIASGILDEDEDDSEHNFRFGLERILDGVALLIERST
ncbi:MAG: TetR/AcrR family transcriptional regulator [Solirubrobacteraceae bacterium]